MYTAIIIGEILTVSTLLSLFIASFISFGTGSRPLRGSADSQFLNAQRRCTDYPGRYA